MENGKGGCMRVSAGEVKQQWPVFEYSGQRMKECLMLLRRYQNEIAFEIQ